MCNSTLKLSMSVLQLGLLLCALSACRHVTVGVEIAGKQVAFIKTGVTSRSEVLEHLGIRLLDIKKERVLVYVWQTRRGWHTTILGEKYDIGGGNDTWLYCIRFDARDRVMEQETIRQREEDSPEKAVADRFFRKGM